MQQINKDQRPIGRNSRYTCFYSEDISRETEKAYLVRLYSETSDVFFKLWLPKSKMLAYHHVDGRDIIDNGVDFVKNPNFGKNRVQYFIPDFFINDQSTPTAQTDEDIMPHRMTDNDVLGVKGIDY